MVPGVDDIPHAAKPFAGATAIAPVGGGRIGERAPLFTKTFELDGEIRRATLRITCLGVYRAHVNGERVGEDELAPGWTDYRNRVVWTDHDVTHLLRQGPNRCDVLLGNGWYRGRLGRPARQDLYGTELALLALLTIHLEDGSVVEVGTDETWGWRESAVIRDDLYDGCIQDLRPRTDLAPRPVHASVRMPRTERATAPPVRALEEVPATITVATDGVHVDVGRNLVGWLRVRIGPRAIERHVRVQHAEVREGGQLALRPLRDAAATDEYFLPAGAEELIVEPVHTFHGFRHATITGIPHEEILEVKAVVVGSDLRETGTWSSSDSKLNVLHRNIRNSARGNFLSIPTDCPQRDERLGWTADMQVFAPVATYLFDVDAFLRSWLDDMSDTQAVDGSVPVVIPDVYRRDSVATAGWGDASVIVPWELFQETGDATILPRYWPMAKRWLKRVDAAVDEHGIWVDGHQYGDWLDPNAPPERPAEAVTDPTLVATAYRVHVLHIASQWAVELGERSDVANLRARWERARAAFQERFVSPRGFLTSESQAGYALAIVFGLLDDKQIPSAGERLADLVRVTDYTVGTGFLGTPVLLEALTRTGNHHVALRVLRGERAPSWLYAVNLGATSVWERWDSLLPDGSVNPGEMTSFNHFALGAVADWLHTSLAGLRRESPGWERASITVPHWSDLFAVSTSHIGPTGEWKVAWTRKDSKSILLDVTVPPGSLATVLDTRGETTLHSGSHLLRFESPPKVHPGRTLREVMDDQGRWDRVIRAVQDQRPRWSRQDIARATMPYLRMPLEAFARAIGLSIPTTDESALRLALRVIAE